MNAAEAVGSLIMTGFRGATLDDPRCRADVRLLKDLHVNGVILFDAHLPTDEMRNIVNEVQVRQLTDDLRHELGSDLIVGIDQEGGEVNRLGVFQDAAVSSMLSAKMQGPMSERQLIATITPVACALADAGINMVFAPCVDLAINPDNPIIAGRDRALGIDPDRVARSAESIISTYNTMGVRCCIKHYPGHGSSMTDTHLGIADITNTYADAECHVYKILSDSMAAGRLQRNAVMTGHLINNLIDPLLPASLSYRHTTEQLRDRLGFDGLVISDSIDMNAIGGMYGPDAASLLVIQAGADIVLNGFNSTGDTDEDHPAGIMHSSLLRAVQNGTISEQRLAESLGRRHGMFPKPADNTH